MFGLLVDAAAIEHREQVSELHHGEDADGQFVEIVGVQLDAIEADARAGQVGADDRASQQLLVEARQVCLVEG